MVYSLVDLNRGDDHARTTRRHGNGHPQLRIRPVPAAGEVVRTVRGRDPESDLGGGSGPALRVDVHGPPGRRGQGDPGRCEHGVLGLPCRQPLAATRQLPSQGDNHHRQRPVAAFFFLNKKQRPMAPLISFHFFSSQTQSSRYYIATPFVVNFFHLPYFAHPVGLHARTRHWYVVPFLSPFKFLRFLTTRAG